MASGMKVWNADGTLQFDATVRLLRVLSVDFSTTSSAGSVTLPANQGQVTVALDANDAGSGDVAEFAISGSTVSWSSGKPRVGNLMVF